MKNHIIFFALSICLTMAIFAGGGKQSSGNTKQQQPEPITDLGIYDKSYVDSEQCTLIIPASVVINSIDGSTVDWGLFINGKKKVTIPSGSHTLIAEYSHPVILQAPDGSTTTNTNYWGYQQQQSFNQNMQYARSGNSTVSTAGTIGAAAGLAGSLIGMIGQASADAKARKIQEENQRRLDEAKRASNSDVEIYQRFAVDGIYELEVVPNQNGPYSVQMKH